MTGLDILPNTYPQEVFTGTHPAMNLNLLREVEWREGQPAHDRDVVAGGTFDADAARKAIIYLNGWRYNLFAWMRAKRSAFEQEWLRAEREYELEVIGEMERTKSVLPLDPDREQSGGDEYNEERANVALPVWFEHTEQMIPRYYEALFGSDPDKFVEVIGRLGNDKVRADTVQEYLNYQQGWEIPTAQIGHDWIRDGIVYSTGIMAQRWNRIDNARAVENVPIWNMWFDPAARHVSDCRFIVWRRYATVAEIKEMRGIGAMAFTDEALSDIAGSIPESADQPAREALNLLAPEDDNRQVTIDLWMERDRWIYVVNDYLIVAIVENEIPPVVKANGKILHHSYPVHLFRPLPALQKRDRDRGVYGLSAITMGLPLSDLQNSVTYLMHKGLARQALGVVFVDPDAAPEAYSGSVQIEAGKMYPVKEAGKNVAQINFPAVTSTCLQAIDFLDSRIERLGGVNNALRGSATFSGETATAKQQDLSQATERVRMGILLAYQTMREFWDVALRLNQAYLEESEYRRVVGERSAWAPISRNDLEGIVGKDLVPTGMPLSSSRAWLAQQGLNIASLIQQMKAGGMADVDPRRILRDTLVAMGYRGVDESIPAARRCGNDPTQENELMLDGELVEVGPNDNHEGHLQQHLALFYSPEVREGMKASPILMQAIEAHVQMHAEALEGPAQQAGTSGPSGDHAPGVGLPGQNDALPGARPKPQAELDAQTGGPQA
jgi:hypothetical protein